MTFYPAAFIGHHVVKSDMKTDRHKLFRGIFGNNHAETHMFIGAFIIGKRELGVFCYWIILVCAAVEQMLLSDT